MAFLLRPISFLFIIFFTYFLKRVGLFKKEHSTIVTRIILNCTLPALAVTAFGGFDRENMSLLFIVLIGLLVSLGSLFLMYAITPHAEKGLRAYYMICVSGYNVGCYGMPVINAFYGSIGTIICVLFDVGNCMMMASGNYAFTSTLLKTDGDDMEVHVGDFVKRFFKSVPVDVYLVLLVLCFLGISIPQGVIDFITPIANANAFLSMFLLGLLFTLPEHRSDWGCMLKVLAFRFGLNGALAAVLFFLLPFSLEIRQILVLCLLCPIGSVSPAFVDQCHGDGELASFTNSICTIVSLIVMSVLVGAVFS